MSNRLIELSAAAAILAAIPTLASAQTVAFGTSPVSVSSCSINASYDALPSGGPYSFRTGVPQSASDIALTYVNKGNAPAKSITFAVKAGDYTQNIVAKGSFAPGVRIERTFAADGDASARPDAVCTVAEVDFADGTAWHAARQDMAAR